MAGVVFILIVLNVNVRAPGFYGRVCRSGSVDLKILVFAFIPFGLRIEKMA